MSLSEPERSVCAVSTCTNILRKAKENEIAVTFHSFPKDESMRRKWTIVCGETETCPTSSYICSHHFNLDDFEQDTRNELKDEKKEVRLKSSAIPSLNLPVGLLNKVDQSNSTSSLKSNKDLADEVNHSQRVNVQISELEDKVPLEEDYSDEEVIDAQQFVNVILEEDNSVIDNVKISFMKNQEIDNSKRHKKIAVSGATNLPNYSASSSNSGDICVPEMLNYSNSENSEKMEVLKNTIQKLSKNSEITITTSSKFDEEEKNSQITPVENLNNIISNYQSPLISILNSKPVSHFSTEAVLDNCEIDSEVSSSLNNSKPDSQISPKLANKAELNFNISSPAKGKHSEIKFKCSPSTRSDNTTAGTSKVKEITNPVNKINGEFKCPLCEYTTHRKGALNRHVTSVHIRDKPHQCTECDYRTSQRHNLKAHIIAVHTKEKLYQCPYCEYQSSWRNSVTIHIKSVHVSEKAHHCPQCEYQTSRKCDLNYHIMSVHRKEKRLQCPHCDYQGCHRGNLNTHILTVHMGEKPFKCTFCGHQTSQRIHLNQHIMSVHIGEKPFNCSLCLYRASDKYSIKKHMRRKHNLLTGIEQMSGSGKDTLESGEEGGIKLDGEQCINLSGKDGNRQQLEEEDDMRMNGEEMNKSSESMDLSEEEEDVTFSGEEPRKDKDKNSSTKEHHHKCGNMSPHKEEQCITMKSWINEERNLNLIEKNVKMKAYKETRELEKGKGADSFKEKDDDISSQEIGLT